ncbi:MAG: hypothetical protein E7566_06510 [Ruminococcaceae bacterium]|nr:hypothetical protein [Oscillospiraceae bacterium]
MKTNSKMKRRILSLLLALLMVLYLTLVSAFSAFAEEGPVLNADGYYEIRTYDDLCWYRDAVNNGNSDINGILINDIVVNNDVLDANGNLNSGNFEEWKGIGDIWNGAFSGIFDGNGKTVSGIYLDFSQGGFFRRNNGVIKNLNIADSYFGGGASICGFINSGSIINCSSSATIDKAVNTSGGIVANNSGVVETCTFTGKIFTVSWDAWYVGGICGMNQSVIRNCYSSADINGVSYIGGISGTNSGTVENCCSTGKITIPSTNFGRKSYGIAEGTVVNSYYINSSMNSGGDAIAVSQAQFESGEIAYCLQGEQTDEIWGQKIGTDTAPVLGGEKVYLSDGNYYNKSNKLAGYSISLGDKIAVNYYMSLTEKTINDANAKMVFTVPDTGSDYELVIPVKDAVKDKIADTYMFTCEVASKEMTSAISAKLVTSEGELVLDDYTVQDYAEVILSDTVKYAKEQELVKKMLNYGTEAQIYFNYNTDNLANDTELMTEEEKTVELYGFAGAPFTLEGEESGVTYYGTALSLETELAFKHYFIIDESVDVQSLEITCDYPATLKKNGSFYELIISDIPAHKMGESSLKVAFGGITLDYTIYSYGALAQNAGKEALWTVVSALAHFAGEATMYAYK